MTRLFSQRELTIAAALTLVSIAPAVGLAQRDAGSKLRGEFGTGFSGPRSAVRRSYRTYSVVPAPTIVRAPEAAPAPSATAQAPTARRAFSYAPQVQAAAPQTYSAPAPRNYDYAPSLERRSRRFEGHVRSYERGNAKFLGHVGY
jgi:hypothetical protein